MKRLIAGIGIVLCGCASQKPDLAAERTAILKADSAWLAAVGAKDVEAALSYWTPDARIIGAGQLPVIGEAAIRAMLKSGFETPGFDVKWHTDDVVVNPAGDMAYSWGSNQFIVPNAKGAADTVRNQGVVVWKKLDGKWRAAVDTWTPNPPPAAGKM